MGTELFLGIDIGGTKISVVVTDESGKILGRAKKKSRSDKGEESVLRRAEEVAREACQDAKADWSDITVVGVGAPSPILPDGTAVNAPNMGWKNFPLTKTLRGFLDKPVFAENDCNAGTFGEYVLGGHSKASTLIGMFMGTGLGGGIVKDGRLITGENNMAAEVGHMTINMGGRPCACKKFGCVEAYASKRGMGYSFKKAILLDGRSSALTELIEDAGYDNVRSSLLKKAWDAGDEVARETLTEAAEYLGAAIGNLITLLGPNVVVLGGGVIEALGEHLLPVIERSVKTHTFPPSSARDTSIELASLGDDAVALGAMAYGKHRLALAAQ
jgi:glucokinase